VRDAAEGELIGAMADYKEGIKKEVAEIKFLIHDLRVERFINEVIHFHVTLNTDLEIYSIDQARILHSEDLDVLKTKAVSLRKAFQNYSNAVKSFSPDRTILLVGKRYIDTIYSTCELILNPLWGRIDKVLAFLPTDSRSARSRTHYLNCIHWISGVARRIEHFLEEEENQEIYAEFDIGTELEEFTRNVIFGYVSEKSGATVDLQLDHLDSAVIGGNRYRFRRMYFNLVMNSVDALLDRKDGVLNISAVIEAERVALRVRDNGAGMTPEKIKQLLTDKETLDGELHSLGFVFVRQTIAEFKGELSIESELDKGTTMTVSLPRVPGSRATPRPPARLEEEDRRRETNGAPREPGARAAAAAPEGAAGAEATHEPAPEGEPARRAEAGDERNSTCGRLVYEDFQTSEAQFPGSLFAIAITEDDRIDFFTHRPYDRYWNMSHEDLSPMYFEATVRGRLEEDDEKRPVLILKEPQSVKEYFEFKSVPERERSSEKHLQMVHDESIRIARRLIVPGLPPQINVELTGLHKFFPGRDDLLEAEPFALKVLAKQRLTGEQER
jgi:signal transduction histidine kinase